MDYMSIIAYIPAGRENRITREELSRLTGRADRLNRKAIEEARKAGVPVILLDPVAPPDDDTLFAVTFTLTGKGDGVTALDDAVVTIVDDKPHPRTMNVTDNLS